MAHRSSGESALHRHLRLLEVFDARHPFLTLKELASASGLPMSTTHRLIGELVREGLLEKMPDRSFRLGLRLWEFASRTPGALGLREAARPWLATVQDRVRQHTQLGVPSGHDVVFIERMSARDAVVNATLIGGRMPLYATSSGLVILAYSHLSLLEEVIADGISTMTPYGIATAEELRKRVRRVRAEGVAITDGFIHPDSRGIAVPILSRGNTIVASMSVVVPNDGSDAHPFIEILRWAAVRTGRALEAAHLAVSDQVPTNHRAALYAGVSKKSLEYFESLGRLRGSAPGDRALVTGHVSI